MAGGLSDEIKILAETGDLEKALGTVRSLQERLRDRIARQDETLDEWLGSGATVAVLRLARDKGRTLDVASRLYEPLGKPLVATSSGGREAVYVLHWDDLPMVQRALLASSLAPRDEDGLRQVMEYAALWTDHVGSERVLRAVAHAALSQSDEARAALSGVNMQAIGARRITHMLLDQEGPFSDESRPDTFHDPTGEWLARAVQAAELADSLRSLVDASRGRNSEHEL